MHRLRHLDGLRGWAALFVILHHLELAFFPDLKGTTDAVSPVLGPFSFLVDGPLAVAIFFLLSGFVLAEATQAARDRPGCSTIGLSGLIIKRWVRLGLPLVAVGMLILVLFTLVGNHIQEAGLVAQSDWMHSLFPPDYRPELLNVLREAAIDAFVGPATPIHDPVLWTIRVEFLGSILVFALCLSAPSGGRRLVLSSVAAILLIAIPAWLAHFCALFALGIMLRDLSARAGGWCAARPLLCDVTGLAMVPTAALLYPVLNLLIPEQMNMLGAIIDPLGHLSQWTARALLIVVGTLLSPSIQAFLRLPVSLFLGRISFGLYLMHLPVLLSLGIASYLAAQSHGGQSVAALLAGLLVVAVSTLSALAFHHAIERPAIRLAAKAGSLVTTRADASRV
jgi:peptidoglycan/LPS O-acetylase OafA/YrhL